jgi:TrmH RNA methyltransferase
MRNRLTDELAVCGLNAVLAAAENSSDKINRLFLREDRLQLFSKICKDLAERKRPYKFCEDEELEKICKSKHHQGVVAMILEPVLEALSREDLEEWSREGRVGLVLHSVGNDHNIGAMIRAAAFFDVKYIVISQGDGEVRLSTSIYRVAEGGMEQVSVRTLRNTAAFLKDASRHLISIGTDPRARQRITDLSRIFEARIIGGKQGGHRTEAGRPGIALVFGNEEEGLPPEVKEACSVMVRIPGTGLMESLNVAQTASIFMHRLFEL